MQGVLDCIENSLIKQEVASAALAHLEQTHSHTATRASNSPPSNYDNNDNEKVSTNDQERVVIESIEDALKTEEQSDDKEIKVEDDLKDNENELENSVDERLQIDENVANEENVPHEEKDLDDDNVINDKSEVEEPEIMKQELDPDDVLFPELIKDESNSSHGELNDPQESDEIEIDNSLLDVDSENNSSDLVTSSNNKNNNKESITSLSPSVVTVSLLNNGLNKAKEKEPLFHLIIDPNQIKARQPVVHLLNHNNTVHKRAPIVDLDNTPKPKKIQPVIEIIDDFSSDENDEDCIEILSNSNHKTRTPYVVDLAKEREGDTIELSDTDNSLDDSIEIVDSNIQ